MPPDKQSISQPRGRQPVSNEGVQILSSNPDERGVKRLSKHEGESNPVPQAESRVVGHEEFGKTKRLIEDKDMQK